MTKMTKKEAAVLGGLAVHKKHNYDGENNPNWKGGISENNYRYKQIQKKRYPEKIRAREKLHYAVKTGKVTKGRCLICNEKNTVAHHKDYNKPLDVVWLCRPCHRKEHEDIRILPLGAPPSSQPVL